MKMRAIIAIVVATLPFHSMPVAADDPPADTPKELRDLKARLDLEKAIFEARKAMLATEIGGSVTLPSGAIEKLTDAIVPSVARFVAYDSLREIASKICADLGAGAYLVSPVSLRDMRDQRLAAAEQLGYLADRAAEATDALQKRTARPEAFGAASALLVLDAVGAIGKAVAGLASFFKTDRKIAAVSDVVDDATAMLAVRSCRVTPKPIIFDATAVGLSASSVAVPEVISLRGRADRLRAVIRDRQAELDVAKSGLAVVKARFAVAKGANGEEGNGGKDEKKNDNRKDKKEGTKETSGDEKKPAARPDPLEELAVEIAKREADVAAKETAIKAASAIMTTVDATLEKLYATDATGMSPALALARMRAIDSRLLQLASSHNNGLPLPVLSVKVQHATGYTQISRAWWRNDRLDFAGGLAVTFQVSTPEGEILKADGYYKQTPWMRLNEGEGTFDQGVRQWSVSHSGVH